MIEMLFAMIIFAIGILGVVKMQIAATQGNASAMRLTEKIGIASSQIEYLMILPYTHSDLERTDGTPRLPETQPMEGYTMSWTVEDNTDDSTIPVNAKLVTVIVDPINYEDDLNYEVEQLITSLE